MDWESIDPEREYTIREVASFIGVHQDTVRAWLIARKVPCIERHSGRSVYRKVKGRYIPILNGVEVIPAGWDEKKRKEKHPTTTPENEAAKRRLEKLLNIKIP